MSETGRIIGELKRAFGGKAWHGPAVFEILDGVDAARAAAHPVPGVHSIWELVLHVTTWLTVPARRVRERPAVDPSDDDAWWAVVEAENFPPVPAPTEEAWRDAKAAMARAVDDLSAVIEGLPAARLEEIVAGKSYSVAVMLHGVVQHSLYHAGQMALLKKAGTKPLGGIGWVDLTVADAAGIRDFYRDVVGWNVSEVSMGDYRDFCMLEPGSGEAAAGVCHARGENADLPPQWMAYVRVADLDASLARCAERGGRLVARPRSFGEGRRYAVIEDPAGAVLAVYEDRTGN
jgi:predicted enzyme related to lactoylglutathione lyase